MLPPPLDIRPQVVGRALLALGDKSPSHMHTVLERYAPALRSLIVAHDAAPDAASSSGQVLLLALVGEFYEAVQQKLKLVVDRLLCLHIVSPHVVVGWLLSSRSPALQVPGLGAVPSALSAEILTFTVQRAQRLPSELPGEVDNLRRKHTQLQVGVCMHSCTWQVQKRLLHGRSVSVGTLIPVRFDACVNCALLTIIQPRTQAHHAALLRQLQERLGMHFIPPGREAELAGQVRHAQEALDAAEARLAGAQQAAAQTVLAVSASLPFSCLSVFLQTVP